MDEPSLCPVFWSILPAGAPQLLQAVQQELSRLWVQRAGGFIKDQKLLELRSATRTKLRVVPQFGRAKLVPISPKNIHGL